ncbi:MAG: hypothetical protein LBH00_13150 [Planctomycetaceae bacterium]|jgi:hypothetical protein|nr:hypothetical protein [Planctomycetaceae bacterium]
MTDTFRSKRLYFIELCILYAILVKALANDPDNHVNSAQETDYASRTGGNSLQTADCRRQQKRFFLAAVCCLQSAVYLIINFQFFPSAAGIDSPVRFGVLHLAIVLRFCSQSFSYFPQSAILLRQTHYRSSHSRQERPNLPQRRIPKNVFVLLRMQAILHIPMAKNRFLKPFCRSLIEILLRISAMVWSVDTPGMTMAMTV